MLTCVLKKGNLWGILGEKGAGKSTLIKLFNGLLRPDSGRITVNGLDPPSSKKVKSRVGMVFQQPADQLFCRTVYEEIAFGPLNFGYSRKETEERVFEALEAASLERSMLSRDPP